MILHSILPSHIWLLSHHDSQSDPIGGSEPSSSCETIYWDFFFLKSNLYLWVWPTSYNKIKISYTYQKNYHRSGVHQNLYTYTESHSLIQKLYFYIYKSKHITYCDEPLLVCWPSCMRMFSDVFSCTYMD